MGDSNTAPETGASPEPATDPETPETGTPPETGQDRLPDDHPVVKALKKANEEAAAARLKVKEFEDAEKSDLERVTGERDAEKERADKAELELARLRAAVKHKLDEDALDLLGTGTPEEIDARAQKLADLAGTKKSDRSPDRTLGRDPKPGGGSTTAQFAALYEQL